MAINEEEVKIRERLTSLETKLGFIQNLLQEIRDELKDQPSKEEHDSLAERVTALEKSQNTLVIKVGIGSGILGFISAYIMKLLMG
jgi:uncharacterized coiled-coil protein SlyX